MLGISPINFSTQADVVLPCHLKTLTFGADFDQSLANVILPEGLNSLIFGAEFNQSLVGTEWLSCKPGACFSRPRLVDGRVLLCFFCFFSLFRVVWRGAGQERACYAALCTGSYVTQGLGWSKDIHVTLCMYVLLRHAWGGVGVEWAKTFMLRMYVLLRHAWGGVGWGHNFHAALLMYVQTIDHRPCVCGSISNLDCLQNCKQLRCQSYESTVVVSSKWFALLSQRDDDTPCGTVEKAPRMKGFL